MKLTRSTIAGHRWIGNVNARNQNGVTLVASLIFLLLLTILAVTSMNTGTLQQKMAGNVRDIDVSLQAAESALRYGERQLRAAYFASPGVLPCLGKSNGIWCNGTVQWSNKSWWNTNGVSYMGDSTKQIAESYEDPRYVVEQLPPEKNPQPPSYNNRPEVAVPHRIIARGVGATGISESVVESYYVVKLY